jgi:2-polyprenyl-6-methoxyphenol hydroxylase-like FAD-dependent oxidoreductase
MNNRQSYQQAIVIGGSMAGLLTARVLSDHFAQVTILERDPVHDRAESRKGQPQTRHVHALLTNGWQIFTHYFPDLRDALLAYGAQVLDMAESMHWYTHGGYRQRFHLGQEGVSVSRPLLEYLVRQRVLARPNVTMQDNCAVKQLLTSPDRTRVTGLVVEQRGATGQTVHLNADLLVDCTGRGSRTPRWLEELGYSAPPETEVKINVAYTSRLYRRNPDDPRGRQWTVVTPDAPEQTRGGGLFAIEGNRWIVSLVGWGGDHCPVDEASFLDFARQLPAPDIYNVIGAAEPLSEIILHKIASNLRRHYEKLSRFPAGFLVLGDAVASFNPTYGQGMTSAAMQARELDALLATRPAPARIAPAFFKRAAKVVDIPWGMALGEDFRFPTTTGAKPLGTDLLNWYVTQVDRATHHDPVVCAAFLQVMNMLAPAANLLKPNILWRVLWQRPSVTAAPSFHPAATD